MKTLNEARILANEIRDKHIQTYPRLILWAERESNGYTVYHSLSGKQGINPLHKKRILL